MKHGLTHILLCAASPLLFADLAQENKNFERTIQLGQQVLERKLVPYNISGIDRHFSTAQQKFAKLSPEHVRKELEAFERIMLQLSVRCNGQPYTPNIGWATQTRTKDYQSEISESFKDWRRSAAALAKFGLHADSEFEIGRINAFRSAAPKLSTLPSDADFDQAFSFYKSIIEERLRLGGRIILLENELDALERTVEFRRSLGGKQKPLNINALRGKLAHWRTAFNTQNYTVCYALERQTDAAMADLRAQAFASDGVTPDVRPGTARVFSVSAEAGRLFSAPTSATAVFSATGKMIFSHTKIRNSTGRSPSTPKTAHSAAMNSPAAPGLMRNAKMFTRTAPAKR